MDEIFRVAVITLRGMWNYRLVGLATAWVVGIASFIVVTLVPERYEASARIFVNTDSILKPLMSGLTVLPNDDQRIGMLSRVMITRPNVDRLVREAGLDTKVAAGPEREALIDSVMKRLKFTAEGRQNIYNLSYRDVDPERAKRAIDKLASLFIEQGKGGKTEDTETARRFIDEQIAVYEQKLQEAEARLKEFRTENLGMAPGEGRTDYFARMAETERMLNQSRLELREAERARDAFRRGLAAATADSGEGGLGPTALAIADLDARLDAQRRNLDGLLQRFTEEHPDVQGARRVLRELEGQRRSLAQGTRVGDAPIAMPPPPVPGAASASRVATDSLRVSLAQSEAQVASLSARVGEYSARYDKLKGSATLVPKLEAELAQLNRDYDVNKRNYESLVAKRESVAISTEMQSVGGVADFRLVDPPRVSPGPVMPNQTMLFPFALVFSLCAGLAAAYIAREVRPAFYDGRALREATGLPLLGVVTLNETESRRQENRRGVVQFVGAVGGLAGAYLVGIIALKVLVKTLV